MEAKAPVQPENDSELDKARKALEALKLFDEDQLHEAVKKLEAAP